MESPAEFNGSNGNGNATAGPTLVVPSERPYHSKRPHKKSRAGCRTCKSRKVKCDEGRPVCRNCVLRDAECIYYEYPSNAHGHAHAHARTSTSTSPAPTEASISTPQTASSSSQTRPRRRHDFFASTMASSSSSSSPEAVTSMSRQAILALPRGHHARMSPPVSIVAEPLYVPPAARDAVEMKLLWFYTAEGFASFDPTSSSNSSVAQILKTKVPAYAFQHPFLMDCLLGLSALQIQLLQQQGQDRDEEEVQGRSIDGNTLSLLGSSTTPRDLRVRAIQYRALAFEGYRKAVERADPETYPGLLACSLLLVALASQSFREPLSSRGSHASGVGDDLFILDWMIVWRGIGLILDMIEPAALWRSGLSELFFRPPIDLDASASHVPNHLLFMVASVPTSDQDGQRDPDAEHVATYYEALRFLGSLYAELRNGFGSVLVLRVITWLTFLPREFVSLASARRPRALVIIAHYLMFLKAVPQVWWTRGIADRELPRLLRRLDYGAGQWDPLLHVPAAVIGSKTSLEVARTILANPDWTPPAETFDQRPQGMVREPSITRVDQQGKLIRYDQQVGRFINVERQSAPESCVDDDERIRNASDAIQSDDNHVADVGPLDIILGGVTSPPS